MVLKSVTTFPKFRWPLEGLARIAAMLKSERSDCEEWSILLWFTTPDFIVRVVADDQICPWETDVWTAILHGARMNKKRAPERGSCSGTRWRRAADRGRGQRRTFGMPRVPS